MAAKKGTKAKAPDLWQMIEDAWTKAAPKLAKARAKPTEKQMAALDEGAEKMCDALGGLKSVAVRHSSHDEEERDDG